MSVLAGKLLPVLQGHAVWYQVKIRTRETGNSVRSMTEEMTGKQMIGAADALSRT